jgi:hypothetical protein
VSGRPPALFSFTLFSPPLCSTPLLAQAGLCVVSIEGCGIPLRAGGGP